MSIFCRTYYLYTYCRPTNLFDYVQIWITFGLILIFTNTTSYEVVNLGIYLKAIDKSI